MNNLKKVIYGGVIASTILWSIGFALPIGATTIADGDLVKTAASSAVYLIQGAAKRVFPHANVYLSWGYPANFSTVKTVTASELAAYSDGNSVPFRDGSLFRGTASSLGGKDKTAVFYVEGATLKPVQSSEIYQALFNDPNWTRVTWVPDDLLSKFNYPMGSDIASSATYPNGSLVKYTGTTQVYLISGGTKRAISSAALTSNRYDASKVITISSDKAFADGDAVTGAESGLLTVGWTTTVAGALTVSLSEALPSTTLPLKATNVALLKVRFAAGSSDVSVTGLTFKRTGVGASADFTGLYLYEGDIRLTSASRTISSDTHTVTFPVLTVSVPANSSKVITLRADVRTSGGASNQDILSLTAVDTTATVSGLPIAGNMITIGSQAVSQVAIDVATQPSNPNVGAAAANIANFKLTASGTSDAIFKSIVLTFTGSLARSAITNLKLYQEDTLLASASGIASNDTATFTLTSAYTLAKGITRNFAVKVDLGGRVGETLTTKIDEASHLMIEDSQYGYGAEVDYATGTFDTGQAITLQGGTLTIANNGPAAGSVAKNTQNVTLLDFTMTAARNVEVRRLGVRFKVSAVGVDSTYVTNLRVKDYATGTTLAYAAALKYGGSVTGNTTITEGTTAVAGQNFVATASGDNFIVLTDIFNLSANTSKRMLLTVDLANQATLEGKVVSADVLMVHYSGSGATETVYVRDVSTGDYVYNSDVVTAPVTGKNMDISATSLILSVASTPISSSVVTGAIGVDSLGLNLKAGDASAILIKQIQARVYAATEATFSTTTDARNVVASVKLYDGTTLLGEKALVYYDASYSTVTFDNLTLTVAKSETKKLNFKVDTKSSLSADRYYHLRVYAAGLSAYESGVTASSVSATNDVNTTFGVYHTVKTSGTLHAERDSSSPDSDYVIADNTNVVISKLKFTASYEQWTVNKMKIFLSTAGNDGSIIKVVLDMEGKGTKDVYLSSGVGTVSDLGWVIPKDSYKILTIKADLKAIDPNGEETGRKIELGIDNSGSTDNNGNFSATGFEALGESGTTIYCAYQASGAMDCDQAANVLGNPMYLRKTKPTISASSTSGTLVSQETALYTFTVAADTKGPVTIKQFTFDAAISGTAPTITSMSFWRGSTQITDTYIDIKAATSTTASEPTNTITDGVLGTLDKTIKSIFVSWKTNKEEEIPIGESRTYTLKGLISGVASGDVVSVRLANEAAPTTIVSTKQYVNSCTTATTLTGLSATAGAAATYYPIIWSDKAKGINHNATLGSGGSIDWTNGALLKTLPGAWFTYSKL